MYQVHKVADGALSAEWAMVSADGQLLLLLRESARLTPESMLDVCAAYRRLDVPAQRAG